MKEMLEHLCSLNGVSGYEDDVCKFIKEKASPYGDKIIVDAMGNLLVFKKGAKSRLRPCAVCAHMDEVGFLVKGYAEDGGLAICPVGIVDPKVVVARRMTVGNKRLTGVIALKAIHLTTPKEREVAPGFDKLNVDIGATSVTQAQSLVELAEQITFSNAFTMLGDECVQAKALDSRGPCAALLSLMSEKLAYDTWFVFTACSKIGSRGAAVASRCIDPGVCIVLEGTPAGDLPEVQEHMVGAKLRGGAAVSVMDRGAIYSRSYNKAIIAAADSGGIKWQYKKIVADITDASTMQNGASGAKVICLSVPVRNMDTAVSQIYMPDLKALVNLARLAVCEVGDCNV